MAKDKDKGKETKPSLEIKNAVKIQDDAVKVKKAKAKDVHAFQSSKEEDCVRFLVRQSLGLTLIVEHPVVRRKKGPIKRFCLFFFLITGTIHTCLIAARTRL